jgi:hypothetical protein
MLINEWIYKKKKDEELNHLRSNYQKKLFYIKTEILNKNVKSNKVMKAFSC